MSSLENRKMMGEFCADNGDYGDDGGVRDMGEMPVELFVRLSLNGMW